MIDRSKIWSDQPCPACGGSFDATIPGGYCIPCGAKATDCRCPPIRDVAAAAAGDLRSRGFAIVNVPDLRPGQLCSACGMIFAVLVCPLCTRALCRDCRKTHVCRDEGQGRLDRYADLDG